jgi:PAS domain S-box-containing protein/putative nucleotidyltransferase with HDIG domain
MEQKLSYREFERSAYFCAQSFDSHLEETEYEPPYGDVTELNTCRLILDSVGKATLKAIAEDAIDLLETSVAIYEKNGDYAFGMFSSGWCRLMDLASRRLCKTEDNREALSCGKWLCHENCWNDSAKAAIISGRSTDIHCVGGINLYAEPIYANDEVVGAINIGYGNSPKDLDKIRELAELFQISEEELRQTANSYRPRPKEIIDLAKKRLATSAKLIGQIVARVLTEQSLKKSEENLFTTLNSIGDAVISTDTTGSIVHINPVAENLTGWDSIDAIGKPLVDVFDIINARTGEKLVTPVENVIQKGRVVGLANHTILRSKDGSQYQIADSASPIKDRAGKTTGVVLVFRDVTKEYQMQEDLLASKNFLQSIFDGIQDGISVLDSDFKIVRVNEWMQKIYSHKIPLIGRKCYEAYQDRKSVCPWCPSVKTLRTGEKNTVEVPYPYEKDIQGWINLSSYPLRNSKGETTGIIESVKDITEQKLGGKALKESERKLQTLMDNLPGMAYRCYNSYNWPMIFVSNGCYDLLGLVPEEMTSKMTCEYGELIHPEDKQFVWDTIQASIIKNQGFQLEYRIQDRNGQERWVWEQGLVVDVDAEGLEILEGFITDITDRKKAEVRMRENEEKFKTLFNTSPDSLALINEDGMFLTVNSSMARNFYLAPNELEGKYFHDVMPKEVANRRLNKGKEAIKSGKKVFFEDQREGMHYQNYYVPIFNYHNQRTFQCIARNITSRKKTQNELEQTLKKLNQSIKGTFQALSSALEQRDPYTFGHQKRVTQLACTIAKEMGLDEDRLQGLYFAGLVHDIGKISIPPEILTKPTKLQNIEFELIKKHAQSGYDILKDIEFPWPIANIVLQHHERINGSGYPQGLTEDKILLESKILAVADVVEAMTSHRPYRPGLGIDIALEEIENKKRLLFDEDTVDTCLRLFRDKGYTFEG